MSFSREPVDQELFDDDRFRRNCEDAKHSDFGRTQERLVLDGKSVYRYHVDIASARSALIRASELSSEKASQLQISEVDLHELNRIALLVSVSGGGDLDTLPGVELIEIVENLLTEDDLAVLHRVYAKL